MYTYTPFFIMVKGADDQVPELVFNMEDLEDNHLEEHEASPADHAPSVVVIEESIADNHPAEQEEVSWCIIKRKEPTIPIPTAK